MEREDPTYPMNGNIVPMTLEHVKSVVEVHLQSFPGFFLTVLGRDFLSELYLGIAKDPSGIAFVALADQNVIGFVAGTDHPAGFYTRLLRKRWWRFAMASLPAVTKDWYSFFRIFRALSMPKRVTEEKGRGTLMSIAVLPEEQKRGIGRPLVNAFLGEANNRGLRKVDLLTDKLNNDSVNHFYIKQGFSLSRSLVTPEGREMNEYIIDLDTFEHYGQSGKIAKRVAT